jgi:hypothetical protein
MFLHAVTVPPGLKRPVRHAAHSLAAVACPGEAVVPGGQVVLRHAAAALLPENFPAGHGLHTLPPG